MPEYCLDWKTSWYAFSVSTVAFVRTASYVSRYCQRTDVDRRRGSGRRVVYGRGMSGFEDILICSFKLVADMVGSVIKSL